MPDERDRHIEKTGWKEIGWFVGLWAIGVGAVLILGAAIKFIIAV